MAKGNDDRSTWALTISLRPSGTRPRDLAPTSCDTMVWKYRPPDISEIVCANLRTHMISGSNPLLNYDVIDGIQQQNKNGVAPNTPYKWHTMTGVRP
jgi:hypothetical protein